MLQIVEILREAVGWLQSKNFGNQYLPSQLFKKKKLLKEKGIIYKKYKMGKDFNKTDTTRAVNKAKTELRELTLFLST